MSDAKAAADGIEGATSAAATRAPSGQNWYPFSAWLADARIRPWLGLGLLFVIEAVMFYAQVADQILPYFPRQFDQTGYAVNTYRLIEEFRAIGWSAFLHRAANTNATGMSFTIQGALLSLVGGPNRAAFVSLNLIYFFALQVCLLFAVQVRTGSRYLAWVAIAILLTLATHFHTAGGIYDYRIDYSALCLYGMWTSLLIASRGFRDGKVLLALVGIGIFLALERYFTILYIGAVLGGLFCAALIAAYVRRTFHHRAIAWWRVRRIFACGAIIVLAVSPFLFRARQVIFNYYFVGHVFGAEKEIRAAERGLSSTLDHLLYYPVDLLFEHFGQRSLRFVITVLVASIAIAVVFHGAARHTVFRRLRGFRYDFLAIILAIVAPLIFLTLDISKSPVVGGIVVVPCILLVVLFAAVFFPARAELVRAASVSNSRRLLPSVTSRLERPATTLMAIGATTAAMAIFLANGSVTQHFVSRTSLERINGLNQAIAQYLIENAITHPKVSFDRVIEYCNVGTVVLAGYERWRQIIAAKGRFGSGKFGIFATPRDVAMQLIQESDIVVLSDPTSDRGIPYPSNTKIREYWDEIRTWTVANDLLLYATYIDAIPYRVYHKPHVRIEGISGNWITGAGLTLLADRATLVRFPFIVLIGEHNNAVLGGEPRPFAVVTPEGQPAITLPTSMKTIGAQYQLVVDARALAAPSGRADIRLTFDRFFVPEALNINSDTRQLVIKTPTLQEMRADTPN